MDAEIHFEPSAEQERIITEALALSDVDLAAWVRPILMRQLRRQRAAKPADRKSV